MVGRPDGRTIDQSDVGITLGRFLEMLAPKQVSHVLNLCFQTCHVLLPPKRISSSRKCLEIISIDLNDIEQACSR